MQHDRRCLSAAFGNDGVQKGGWIGAGMGLFFWVLINAPVYLSPGYVPDDLLFASEAKQFASAWQAKGTLEFITTQDNYRGYGAAYWIGYAGLFRLDNDGLALMRAVALLCMLLVPACYWFHAHQRRAPFGWAAILLWLTTPMAWWTGKLTGPELPSMALGLVGVVVATSRSDSWSRLFGGVLLGLAVAIKLNALPMVVFAMTLGLLRGPSRVKFLAATLLGLALGTLGGNYFAINAPDVFQQNVAKHSFDVAYSWDQFVRLFSQDRWCWDAVYNGNLFSFGITLVALTQLAVLLAVHRMPLPVWIAMILTLAASVFMFLSNGLFYGWYWFPMIPLLCLCLCEVPETSDSATRWVWAVFAVCVALGNFATQYQLIHQQLRVKYSHLETLEALPMIEARLDRMFSAMPPEMRPRQVIDYTFYDVPLSLQTVPVVCGHWEPERLLDCLKRPSPKTVRVAMVGSNAMVNEETGWAKRWPIFAPAHATGYVSVLYKDEFVTVFEYLIPEPGF